MPSTKIYLSSAGRPVDPDAALVPVFDRGFLFGDAVFETLRTAGGRPVAWAQHLARLRRSGAGLGLDIPWIDAALRDVLGRTHAATGNEDSLVRLVVTRGAGPLMLDPRQALEPQLVLLCLPLVLPAEDTYRRGLRARIVDITRVPASALDPALKTANYLANIQALRAALAAGADDAILPNTSGFIAEGATSNVFAVIDGALRTPPVSEGILPGITRALVLEQARDLGVPAAETRITPDELRRADEVFLTSSVRGPIAVTTLDDRSLGATEGPLTERLRRHYAAVLDRHARD